MYPTPQLLISSFQIPLVQDRDFSDTWGEHGGLTGHIDHDKRIELNTARVKKEWKLLEYVSKNQTEFPMFTRYLINLERLCEKFGSLDPEFDVAFDYFLISGFGRSGGTYLQREVAKMRNFDIYQEHIHFCHDFFPRKEMAFRAAFDYLVMIDDLHNYFSALITLAECRERDSFFFRSALGPLYIPYMSLLKKITPGLNLIWRHIIRDIHGITLSLQKYYKKQSIDEVYPAEEPRYAVSRFDTGFGRCMVAWFMENCAVLPTMRGLPFWDIRIDTARPIPEINDQIDRCVTDYIRKYRGLDCYDLGRPVVVKFGKEVEEHCNQDAQIIGTNPGYRADRFNYRSIPEVDDRYTGVYDHLVQVLAALYQAFGIDFDGRLDRV